LFIIDFINYLYIWDNLDPLLPGKNQVTTVKAIELSNSLIQMQMKLNSDLRSKEFGVKNLSFNGQYFIKKCTTMFRRTSFFFILQW